MATPIGNLQDITLRALRVLRECDGVIAEDGRRTRALLTAHGLSAHIYTLPAFAEQKRVPALVERLVAGDHLALCTDSGTPVVSDPGARLVAAATDAGIRIETIPGASALTSALSICGLDVSTFTFLGFPPRTPGKLRTQVGLALQAGKAVIFFESPYRVTKTLSVLSSVAESRPVVVARELTKMHETLHRGTCETLAEEFATQPPRGECTVIIGPAPKGVRS